MELQSKHNGGPKIAQQSEIGKKHKLNNQKPDVKKKKPPGADGLDVMCKDLGSIYCTPEKIKQPQKSTPPQSTPRHS